MRRALPPIAALLLLASCGERRLHADGAWVRLAAVPGGPAAAYLTIHGGERPTMLTGIASGAAARAEMHETMAGPMASMRPLAHVPVPARGEARFAPGGRHVMLFGVAAAVKPGGTIPLTLRFARVGDVRVDAQVIGAGDAPPR